MLSDMGLDELFANRKGLTLSENSWAETFLVGVLFAASPLVDAAFIPMGMKAASTSGEAAKRTPTRKVSAHEFSERVKPFLFANSSSSPISESIADEFSTGRSKSRDGCDLYYSNIAFI